MNFAKFLRTAFFKRPVVTAFALITNRSKIIKNRGSSCYYKLWQRLVQIGQTLISIILLQIGTIIVNRCTASSNFDRNILIKCLNQKSYLQRHMTS